MYQLTIKDNNCQKGDRTGFRERPGFRDRKMPGFSFRYYRFIISFLAVVLGLILVLSLNSSGSKPAEYIKLEVNRGDTLWGIASLYNSTDADPRRLISKIKQFNQLQSVILQPGQVIKIPLG